MRPLIRKAFDIRGQHLFALYGTIFAFIAIGRAELIQPVAVYNGLSISPSARGSAWKRP